MTYCVGVKLEEGLIFASDSRTHAGVDNYATFCKMTVFERVGDRVLVHDVDADLRLIPGVVTMVETAEGPNDVSIRVHGLGSRGSRVVRPQRLAVHLDPLGFDQQCWRCAGPGR